MAIVRENIVSRKTDLKFDARERPILFYLNKNWFFFSLINVLLIKIENHISVYYTRATINL